jgi:hypothetical protein
VSDFPLSQLLSHQSHHIDINVNINIKYIKFNINITIVIAALDKKLATEADQLAHVAAQGTASFSTSATTSEVPPMQKGCIRTAKVMLDLKRVRYAHLVYRHKH